MIKEKKLVVYREDRRPREALPELLVFDEFKGLSIINHTEEANNSVCIYCSGHGRAYNETITLKTEVPFASDSMFFDWAGGSPFQSRERNGILFVSKKGTNVGLFVPEKKMLIMVDITHTERYVEYARIVLNEIFSILRSRGYEPKKIFKKRKRKIRLHSLGADPEFGLIDDYGALRKAEDFYDSLHDPVGCDGSGDQLELRPKPGSITTVIKSLRELLEEVSEEFDIGFEPDYSYGGHIHFGYGMPMIPSEGFLEVLDDFLGEKTKDLVERYDYGELSDYETKNWGFEYRTPSAAIFSNPEIARISLKIAKLIGERVGETIVYNYPPTKEDYIKLGLTDDQAEYFLTFTQGRKQFESILGFWGIKKENRVIIRFRDEWSYAVKSKIKREIGKAFPKLKKNVGITLFGLASERGNVNTIPVEGYKVIDHEKANTNTIGVAYNIRMGNDIDNFIKALKEVIRCA